MNERPNISEAMKRIDTPDLAELAKDHIGAVSINAILEAMYVLHRRSRFTGSDYRRYRVIRRALLDLPAPSIEEQTDADIGNGGNIPSTPMLDAIEAAVSDAVALPAEMAA